MNSPQNIESRSRLGARLGDALVSGCFALFIVFGLDVFSQAMWRMIDGGLASGIRWPGQVMLLALIAEGVGIHLLTGSMPQPGSLPALLRGLSGLGRGVIMLSRWLVSLMVIILGLLGLGIDVRPNPGPVALLFVLGLPVVKEVFVYRRLFNRRNENAAVGPGPTIASREPGTDEGIAPVLGQLLSLPLRLTMVALIERGLFADLAKGIRRDIGDAAPVVAVAMGVGFGLVIAALYFVLIFGPLRAPWLVRLVRDKRYAAWLPSFIFEVVLIVSKVLW